MQRLLLAVAALLAGIAVNGIIELMAIRESRAAFGPSGPMPLSFE